jgi:DNA-binding NarL/FixJ family response regulator
MGKGTEIFVSIPIAKNSDEAVQEGVSADDIDFAFSQILLEESIDGDKPFILVVDDNVEMLNFLRSKLREKYNVIVARNGREALERMNSLSNLDLIISDVMMNEMDGFDFCNAVSQNDRFAHIPFVFLSAKGSVDDRLTGLNLGAVSYIEKPFKIEELVAKVDSILGTLKRHREAFVSKAYQSVMGDISLRQTSVSKRRCAFTDNCKKYHLTSREVEIIRLLISGSPYKIISADLGISEKTVSKHISNIFSKVGVNNKIELIGRLEAQELLNGSNSEVR